MVIFAWPPSHALVDYHLEIGRMSLNIKGAQLLKIMSQVPGIWWAKGCVFDDCVSII